ncbi:hypothetical protein BJX62DRAFT_249999 [Aspergillus germanicus]
MSPRVIVVIGATGAQGGAVVRELLQYPSAYRIRALTRDPSKPASQSLIAMGVDVQQADLDEGTEKLAAAFAGAHIIYALTDFWQKQSAADELTQGKAIVGAAAQTGSLEHFIWSTLPDPVELSDGRFMNVHHWKSKSLVTEYILREHPDLWAKTTAILFPNYFENCVNFPGRYLPTRDASGTYTLAFPHSATTVMPNVSIADTGALVRAILEAGSTYFTKTIAFYSQALSEADKLSVLEKKYNIPTQYRKTSAEKFQKLLESCYNMASDVALDFTEQLMIFEECGNIYARSEFVQATEIPCLSLQTWSEFLDQNDLLSKIIENH